MARMISRSGSLSASASDMGSQFVEVSELGIGGVSVRRCGGRSLAVMVCPFARTEARSMMLESSRTFPG